MKLYKYTTAEYGLAAIREKRLKVTTLHDANDPNEWLPVMRDPDTGMDWHANPEFRGHFRYFWSHRFGFISLSRHDKDLLMWGHYADKFRGMALEFEVLDQNKVTKVEYTVHRYVLDGKSIGNPTEEDLKKFIERKDNAWGYEGEFRLLANLHSCTTKRLPNGDTIYFQSFDPDIFSPQVLKLTGVVLGSECTVTMEDIHQAFNRNPPVGFSVLQLAADSPTYALVVSDISMWNSKGWVHHTI